MTVTLRAVETIFDPNGFSVNPYPTNERLQVVTLSNTVIKDFIAAVEQWPVQALEYKPFLRFTVADTLDALTENTLGVTLNSIMQNRATAAFVLDYEGDNGLSGELATEFEIKLSTAVAHLIGLSDHDAMFGQYYARFTVRNVDSSDSYLRQAHRRMELHNDGTYVAHRTDFVLMQKLGEENMVGGESLLLHVDDWEELDKFYQHPLAKQDIIWSAPKSKNVGEKMVHPVFFEEDKQGKPHMLYIDQFAEPQNMAQGRYLFEMGESLEADPNYIQLKLPVGSLVVVQNHCWLHGRDKFVAHPDLSRELLRQRGHFTK
jgi:protein CsiD